MTGVGFDFEGTEKSWVGFEQRGNAIYGLLLAVRLTSSRRKGGQKPRLSD